MIVDPDFLEHWKTRMLADLLGRDPETPDEMAPLYLIRLWAHCQQRKSDRFDSLSPAALKSICRFKGAAAAFEAAMLESGFIERSDGALIVSGWRERNASLIATWENGKKGGRPKKSEQKTAGFAEGTPPGTPPETHGFPFEFPEAPDWVSHAEPIREEKIREDQRGSNTALGDCEVGGASAAPTRAVDLSIAVRKFGVQSQPSDPRLQSLAEQGITADTMTAACEAAKKAKTGSGEALNLGYVISIIKRWSEEAANLRVAGVQAPRAGSKAQAVEQNNRDAVEEAARRIEARERGEQAPQTDPYTIDMEPA